MSLRLARTPSDVLPVRIKELTRRVKARVRVEVHPIEMRAGLKIKSHVVAAGILLREETLRPAGFKGGAQTLGIILVLLEPLFADFILEMIPADLTVREGPAFRTRLPRGISAHGPAFKFRIRFEPGDVGLRVVVRFAVASEEADAQGIRFVEIPLVDVAAKVRDVGAAVEPELARRVAEPRPVPHI